MNEVYSKSTGDEGVEISMIEYWDDKVEVLRKVKFFSELQNLELQSLKRISYFSYWCFMLGNLNWKHCLNGGEDESKEDNISMDTKEGKRNDNGYEYEAERCKTKKETN